MVREMEATESRQTVRKRSSLLQWDLRTLLLLTAVVAVWGGFLLEQHRNARLKTRVKALSEMTGELRIEDPAQITVVHIPDVWYDEPRWDIYLPEGRYAVRMATRDVEFLESPPAPRQEKAIEPGRHRIELLQSRDGDVDRIRVLVDGQVLLEATETPDWNPRFGSMGGANFGLCSQLDPDERVVLFRRVFMKLQPDGTHSTTGSTDGLVLWIEKSEDSLERE